MRRIALSNQKGGVGKTTSAVNLAVGLGDSNQSVLLIDLDPQADATYSMLDRKLDDNQETIYEVLLDDDLDMNKAIVETPFENVSLVPATGDLSGAENELDSVSGNTRLLHHLEQDQPDADIILIDCPPSLGRLAINGLAAAEEILVPVDVGVFALRGIQDLLDTVQKIRENLKGVNCRVTGSFVVGYDHTNVADDVIEAIETREDLAALETKVPKNIAVEEAHSRPGESIYSHEPGSTGAEAYAQLTKEILGSYGKRSEVNGNE
jgi:chromosome partitioning protein